MEFSGWDELNSLNSDTAPPTLSPQPDPDSSAPPSPNHPLKSRAQFYHDDLDSPPSASTSSLTSSPNPATQGQGIRSRKATPTIVQTPHFVDSDITRPSLKRLTDKETTAHARALANGRPPAGKPRKSLDELGSVTGTLEDGEREVVIHEVSMPVASSRIPHDRSSPPRVRLASSSRRIQSRQYLFNMA